MPRCQQVGRPILQCLRQTQKSQPVAPLAIRNLSTTSARRDQAAAESTEKKTTRTPSSSSTAPPVKPAETKPADPDFAARKLDPNVTTLPWAERKLLRKGTPPIGSRRRRAAVRTSQAIPFELMPYQCFQEARKVLQEDREDKIRQITAELERIQQLSARDPATLKDGSEWQQRKLADRRSHVETLKILADINDPLVKRRFEDGKGDMSKPIYRHLAREKWSGQPRKIMEQRVSQFHIVPDVLPKFRPQMDVQLYFRQQRVSPGEIVSSLVSEKCPRLRVQCFDKHERLVSIVVLDSDVPDPSTDSFARRCHYLAANIPLSPVINSLPLAKADKDAQLAVPWLPAFSQKGSPYHRLSVFILEQQAGEELEVSKLRELYAARDGFSLKSFRDKFNLNPVGFNLFRTVWDEGTAAVMQRAGVPGADVEFKRVKVDSLKEPRKRRGWEARHEGPKYRHLWKYTHRIASPRRKFVR